MKKNKLFLRIFFTFFMTAVILIGAFTILFKSFSPERKIPGHLEKHIIKHFSLLQNEVGSSPNPEQLKQFFDDYGLQLRHENLKNYSDELKLPDFLDAEKNDIHLSDEILMGKTKNFFFLLVKNQQPKILWLVEQNKVPKGWRIPFITIIGAIVFILVLSFLTIHWILKPLRLLTKGVQQFSDGNLKYRIPLSQKSDFFDLADTFNQMAVKIEKMILSKEVLLRDVSHELRSPLTRINVAVDLIDDKKIKTILKEDIQKMEYMIQNLLESYKLKHSEFVLKKSNEDLIELIQMVVKDYANEKVKFVLDIPGQFFMNIDLMQMERVFRNLVENAIKYADRESLIITITLKDIDQGCEIRFHDNGVGIDEKHLSSLFEPFYRVNQVRTPEGNGFGLGLSIVKSIIEAHGGKIHVTSEINKETSFIFSITK